MGFRERGSEGERQSGPVRYTDEDGEGIRDEVGQGVLPDTLFPWGRKK